jgi:hypothetical protein
VNYGFGYGGIGFVGGGWRGGVFAYNRSVTNVNVTVVHNTYNQTVTNTNVSHTSFNGGTGGTTAQPNAQERSAENEKHTPATSEQTEHEHTASTNRNQFASVNHGAPGVAASPKAGVMSGSGVVGAKGSGANGADKPRNNANGNSGKGNGAGSGKANGQGNKSGKPPKNPPPPKNEKGGKGDPKPKEHQ